MNSINQFSLNNSALSEKADDREPAKTEEKRRILPPTYLLAAITLAGIVGLLLPLAYVIPPFWNLLGLVPMLAGIIFNLTADKAFHRSGTTVKPFESSSMLVSSGLYRISRNPMYLGFVMILLGEAILLRSLTPYVFVILFAELIDRQFINMEEKMLAEQFGEAWTDYKMKTPRWI